MSLVIERNLKPELLAVRLIANVNPDMAAAMKLLPGEKSVALFTSSIDDPLYIGGDEATKKAEVRVASCVSHFAGGSYPSGPLAGEALLVLAAPNPAEATAGINALMEFVEQMRYATVNKPPLHVWLSMTISRTGTYLSELAGVPAGSPIAYVVGNPLESNYAIERALKAADVKMGMYVRNTETNNTCAFLTGSQSACRAACAAYDEAMLSVVANPLAFQ